jgi:hypothetical protein
VRKNLACSLLRYSSISRIASSSISLRYSFIHSSLSPLLVSSFTNHGTKQARSTYTDRSGFCNGVSTRARSRPKLLVFTTVDSHLNLGLHRQLAIQMKLTIPEEGNNNTN